MESGPDNFRHIKIVVHNYKRKEEENVVLWFLL